MTRTIERHVDVSAPSETAYTRWCEWSETGEIAPDVERVDRMGPRSFLWRAEIAGVSEAWVAEVTERIPGRRIAWRSRAGASNAGCVTFHRLGDDRTRVMLQLEIEPDGLIEKLGAALGFVDRSVEAALQDFAVHVESAGLDRDPPRARREQAGVHAGGVH